MKFLFLLPLLNLAGFLLAIFFGKSVAKGKAHLLTVPFLVVSVLLSVFAFGQIVFDNGTVDDDGRTVAVCSVLAESQDATAADGHGGGHESGHENPCEGVHAVSAATSGVTSGTSGTTDAPAGHGSDEVSHAAAAGVVRLASADGGETDVAQGVAHEELGKRSSHGIDQSFEWFTIGGTTFHMGVHVDGLAVVLCLMVSVIALMIQIYSIGYMKGEVRYVQFMATISLFAGGMLLLVLASNLFLAIFGWEIMGLCSYLLIGHYWEERENQNAAIKAFLTTRTGDIGLLSGSFILFGIAGTLNIQELNDAAVTGTIGGVALTTAAIALFIGVIGKSAQFPLHTWLPDAMAGPTPVSALIHAATMVVAGVYLVARLYGVFAAGVEIGESGVNLIVAIGCVTAIIAAFLALVQWDIKKVLAYSTISQLGYMVMALGAGAWGAGVFHVFTHAFFKALLFLGSGSVIHGCHHEQDMRQMGGLRKLMPKTFWTWTIGTLALSGIIPFAGFWSKDEILGGAYQNGYEIFFVGGAIVAFLTAFYMGRATILTFFGDYRGHAHPHESPSLMTGPLLFLAVPSALVGLFGTPWNNVFLEWVQTFTVKMTDFALFNPLGKVAVHHEVETITYVLAGVSLALALLGLGLSWVVFQMKKTPGDLTERIAALRVGRTLLENKYYLDDLYGGIVYTFREPLAKAVNWTNKHVIDVVLDLTGKSMIEFGKGTYFFDQDLLDKVYDGSAVGADRGGNVLKRMQTGQVQQYLAVFLAASAGLGILLLAAN